MADGTSTPDLRAGNGLARPIPAEPCRTAPLALGVPGFMAPQSLGEVRELARMIALAEWAPECYRDLDGNYHQPKIELAIMHGATVGLGPIAAVNAIALIGGKPSIWGDGALSVIEHSGLLEDMVEDYEVDDEDGLVAICTMKRRDRPSPIVTRFSMAMAERAGLTDNEGPWQTYPERMLRMRARSWTMRDAFADVLRGLQLREEVQDYVDSRGGRSGRAPQGEASPLGNLRPRPSPRPRRPLGSTVERRSDCGEPSTSPPPSRNGEGRPSAETPPVEETFTLVDADGVVLEVASPDALRAGFERLVFDKHLSPDQIAGVWESNEPARQAIARLFGLEALAEATEHLKSVVGVRKPPSDDQPEPAEASRDAAGGSEGTAAARASDRDRTFELEISPTCGVQKIFQQYRAALTALCDGPDGEQPTIAKFREANIGVERRLRAKIGSRMEKIDAIYRHAGLEL